MTSKITERKRDKECLIPVFLNAQMAAITPEAPGNLEKRLWEHENDLGAAYTKSRLPVKIVYCEEYDRVEDAFAREKQIQGWSRRKKKALIEEKWEKLVEYSKNYTRHGNTAEYSGRSINNSRDTDY